jgi:uncharacterized protein (TIRG00374 family)
LRSWGYKLVGLLVSVVFLYLAVRRVDLMEALRVLGSLNPLWLLAGVFVYLALALPVRAQRWRLLLARQKALSLGEVLVPTYVGYMANNVLPARTGELYRAHFLGRRAGTSRSGAAASIVVERAFDGLVLVALMLVLILLFPQSRILGWAALVTALVFLALAAGILVYGLATEGADRLVDRVLELLPGRLGRAVGPRLKLFMGGLRGASSAAGVLAVVLLTVGAWTLEACAVALVLGAVGISLTFGGFLLVYSLSALAVTLPSGPGSIGPYQYAFVLGLGAFGVSEEVALAASVAVQLGLFGPLVAVGLVLLLVEQTRAGPPSPGSPRPEA